MGWYVYMLRCGDGSLYTGSTNDLPRRLTAHQSGKGAKYTRSRPPVELAYWEEAEDKSAALRREAAIKRLRRPQKEALIAEREKKAMTEMRRKDRLLTEAAAWEIVDACEYAVLSVTAEEGAPYAAPLNVAREENRIYFHGAQEGRKARLLEKRPRVCLTCVSTHENAPEEATMKYASAIVFGAAAPVEDPVEKGKALRLLCQKHTVSAEVMKQALAQELARTAVWCITADAITGKSNRG